MSFFRDSVRTFIVRFAMIFVNILAGIIAARWLGPEGVGLLALVVLLQSFAFRFGNLGFGSSCAFFLAKGKASSKSVLRIAMALSVLMSLLSCLVLASVRTADFSPWQEVPSRIFLLGLVTVLPFFLMNFLRRILSGQLNILAVNLSEIVRTAFYLPALVLFVVVFEWGVVGAVYALILSDVAVVGFLYVNVGDDKSVTSGAAEEPNRIGLLREMWRYGRWNYLIMFSNFPLEELPFMFLSVFFGKDQIGLFSLGRNLIRRFRMLPESFSGVLFPYAAASEKAEAIRRTNILCRNFVLISAATGAGVAAVIEPLVVLLYGEAFAASTTVFYLLIPAMIFWPVSQFLTVHIAAAGEPKRIFWYRLSALPGCLLFSYLLVAPYGIAGAALSVSATYFLVALVSLVAYVRITESRVIEVILPQPADLTFYKRIIDRLPLRVGS